MIFQKYFYDNSVVKYIKICYYTSLDMANCIDTSYLDGEAFTYDVAKCIDKSYVDEEAQTSYEKHKHHLEYRGIKLDFEPVDFPQGSVISMNADGSEINSNLFNYSSKNIKKFEFPIF
jgi:hypothetical protein